jgi:hypothetical protein
MKFATSSLSFNVGQHNRRTIVHGEPRPRSPTIRRLIFSRTISINYGEYFANTGERRRSSRQCARSSLRTGERFVKNIFNLNSLELRFNFKVRVRVRVIVMARVKVNSTLNP